ncbi:MAG: hypothetical protein ABI863_14755 [Ginsengibacter sp.]
MPYLNLKTINSNQLLSSPSIVSPVSGRQLKSLNFFWIGFMIYTLCSAITQTDRLNIKICQGLQIIGLIFIFTSIFSLIQLKFDNPWLRFIYVLYSAWLLSVIYRGGSSLGEYSYIKDFFFSPYEGMLYFAPLILLFPRTLIFYKKLFDVIIYLGICNILFDMVFIKDLLNPDHSNTTSQAMVETFSDLSFSSGFILLTYAYHTKKRQIIAIGVTMAALLFAIIRARRGLIFMYSTVSFISYLLYVFHSKLKFVIIYLTIFIALLGGLYISGLFKPSDNKLFGFLVDRGDEDTRSLVEIYYYDDMKFKDWIIGRGTNGKYFAPNIEENQVTNFRHTIETGYEQTILKGGFVSIGLFLLIALPAIILGVFYSKNILSKVAAIWILLSLVNSYPSTVNAFTLQYLLVWISIGICYSKEIRNMAEGNIKKNFHELQGIG